jgi:ABC-type dipeptide/oligopeptide/nickel transport system ATPase subunit
MKVFAGLRSDIVSDNVYVTYSDNTSEYTNFSKLKHSRIYLDQGLPEEFRINDEIKHNLSELFPSETNIQIVQDFLINDLKIFKGNVPSNFDECPHSNISGGERQRFTVGPFIWNAEKTGAQWLILDEIDRALDKDTAMHMIKNIVKRTNCHLIIISHLSEVKNMLINELECVDQILRYDDSDPNEIQLVSEKIQTT